jgi:hypothetical protein
VKHEITAVMPINNVSHCLWRRTGGSDLRFLKIPGTGGFTINSKIPNNRFFRNFYFPISRLFMFIISSKTISSKVKE